MTTGKHQRTGRRRGWSLVTASAGIVILGGVFLALVPLRAKRQTGVHDAIPASGPSATTTVPLTPLTVAAMSPTNAAGGVASSATVSVTLSEPPTPGSVQPTLSPPVAGSWTLAQNTYIFTPTVGFVPSTTYTVSLPQSASGIERGHVVHLAAAFRSTFTAAPGSVLRLQELLASLDFLPLSFTPSQPSAPPSAGAASVPVAPVAGGFAWRFPNIPPSLAATWREGQSTVMTTGAVMAFEAAHGLRVDGVAGPAVWNALLQAVAHGQKNSAPYDYFMVSKTLPERLVVWRDGQDILSTDVNSGVPGADTADGTYPVYSRFAQTRMRGTDPDGSKYDVQVSWVAYFNGSDAVHAYPRATYGSPQSNGCVEVPPSVGEEIWGMDPYGTLVTVS